MSKPTAKRAGGLRAEWNNVRWQRLRSKPQSPGALILTGRVIAFTAAWAVAFALCDVVIATLMRV